MTFALVTDVNKEENIALARILYIYYLFYFYKDKKNKIQALINSNSKVNAIILAYALKLGLKICRTNVKAQKITGFIFKIFEIVLARFQVEDRLGRVWFF